MFAKADDRAWVVIRVAISTARGDVATLPLGGHAVDGERVSALMRLMAELASLSAAAYYSNVTSAFGAG
jgi:hypothetical protein